MSGAKWQSLVVGLALCWGGSADAQPTDPIAQTLRDWEARLQRLHTVRYTLSGTAEKFDRPPASKAPRERPVSYVVLIDFDKRRIRIASNDSGYNPDGDRFIPSVNTTAYDGEAHRQIIPREINELGGSDNPDAYISRGTNPHANVKSHHWPILMAHGIVPTVNRPPLFNHWPTKHEADEFHYRGKVAFDGRTCTVLRSEPHNSTPALVDEFWIDPARGGAIVRHVYLAGKNPFSRLDTAFEKTEHGWLPKSWTHAESSGDKLIEVVKLTVDRLEVNPVVSDTDFVLPIAPGSLLQVDQYPDPGKGLAPDQPASQTFRVDASGKWIKLDETGFTTAEGVQLPPETRGWRWWWYAAIALGLAAAAFAAVRLRRRTAGTQHGLWTEQDVGPLA